MALEPTLFASPLIAALRGGIGDTGSASTVSLLPNIGINYAPTSFVPFLRGGNINNVQPFAPMPYVPPPVRPAPILTEPVPELPPYYDIKPDTIELQKTEPEPEPVLPDYSEDLWPPIEPEPVAPSYTEPPPAISFPITMPSLIESQPLEPEKTPSVEVYEVPVSDTPPVQTDPVEDFELDRELGLIQQSDVMEPVAAPAPPPSIAISYPFETPSVIESQPISYEPVPSVDVIQSTSTDLPPVETDPAAALFELDRELGDIQQSDVMEPRLAPAPVPALPEDFGYVAPQPEPVAPEVFDPVPALPEDFGYVAPEPEPTAFEPVPAFPEDFGYVEPVVEPVSVEPAPVDPAPTEPVAAFPEDFGYVAPELEPIAPEVVEPIPAFPEDFGYVEPTPEPAPEPVAMQPEVAPVFEQPAQSEPSLDQLIEEVLATEPVPPSYYDAPTTEPVYDAPVFEPEPVYVASEPVYVPPVPEAPLIEEQATTFEPVAPPPAEPLLADDYWATQPLEVAAPVAPPPSEPVLADDYWTQPTYEPVAPPPAVPTYEEPAPIFYPAPEPVYEEPVYSYIPEPPAIEEDIGIFTPTPQQEPAYTTPYQEPVYAAPEPVPTNIYTDVPLIQEPVQDSFYYVAPSVDYGTGPVYAEPDPVLDALIEEVLATEPRPDSYYQVQTTDPTVAEPNPYQELFDLLKFNTASPQVTEPTYLYEL